MSAEQEAKEKDDHVHNNARDRHTVNDDPTAAEPDSDEDDEDEEEDEPRLKYTKLTSNLAGVYRNGDATSTFMVGGDKMVTGTHNGSIHVLSLPTLQSLRVYRAHTASVTAISISPVPPAPPALRLDGTDRTSSEPQTPTLKPPPSALGSTASPRTPKQQSTVPRTPTNDIYIATASIDGHVCVSSLVDAQDVMLRNFARPVQAVALSPEFKSDKTYLSGGLAGNLILTVGGKAGVSADANTNSAAAAASGWLGSIGLGSNTGKDTVLHSGEGSISNIKWSNSGKFVAWVNEHGIKIMRSHLKLESADADSAWKRIGHVDRPNRKAWEDMAGVWKGRLEWISDQSLESDEEDSVLSNGTSSPSKKVKGTEKLVIGWGDTAWVLHVHPGGPGVGRHVGERSVGSADIVHKLQFHDCVVSGLSLYTPSLLAVLAYRTRDDNDKPLPSAVQGTPTRGRHHRQTGLSPELRLINVVTSEEVDVDTLTVSRFETLSAADYHLGTVYIPLPEHTTPAQQSAFGYLGSGLWDVGAGTTRLFSSSASVRSAANSGENGKASIASPVSGSMKVGRAPTPSRKPAETNPAVASAGLKLFIHSPYDCVFAIKRDLGDHLTWLLEHQKYGAAWELLDEHPNIIQPSDDRRSVASSPTATPSKGKDSLEDFFADDSASQTTASGTRGQNSAVAKEKRRIGDMWLQQLISAGDWATAGKVAGKVLGTSSRWEHWVLAFAHADRFDEITPYIPSTEMKPALPSFVYEVVLGHYISTDRQRFKELLDQWDPELFDITSVTHAIENKLESQDVTEDTVEEGEQGRDWRILLDSLAKLYLANGRARDALSCYVRLQNADAAMALIRDNNLAEAISDDIPGLVTLRVSKEQLSSASLEELEEASLEPVRLLVDEAHRGVVRPETVVDQLFQKSKSYHPFLFFYFRALWQGQSLSEPSKPDRHGYNRKVAEGQAIVEQFGDLAVSLFAEYDRDLLMTMLRSSTSYTYEKASQICEQRHYVPELVYLLSKTGQTKNALFLIIGELGDVSQAIAFAKENPDLWDNLLDYSMDKPTFIRGLLEEVGTSIDPIDLVRRIPDGLEIEGLRDGIGKMIREYEIQHSISEGVARVLRGEVSLGMDTLRAGQKKAIKFDVHVDNPEEIEVKVDPVASGLEEAAKLGIGEKVKSKEYSPGHCVQCGDLFAEDEKDTLIGFACGHVFHLMCLLDNHSDADASVIQTIQDQAATDEGPHVRSVRAKVDHAWAIKNVLKGGCPVCVDPEKMA